MHVTSVTVGMPVSNLAAARRWYEAVLELDRPDVEPVEGVVEYEIGGCWLQLGEDHDGPGGPTFRVGVADIEAEWRRLVELGLAVDDVERVEGVIAFCDFRDPDGNKLGLYSVLATSPERE